MADAEKQITTRTTDEKTDTSKANPSVDPEFMKNLPPEAKKVVEFGMMSMQRFGPMPNPLADKITEKHIDKILDIAAKDDEHSFKDAGESRKYTLLYILVFAALFVFTTIFLVGSELVPTKICIKKSLSFLPFFWVDWVAGSASKVTWNGINNKPETCLIG